ncbi:MAG: hypothetical protein IPQ23_22410 [Cytophagaceae bacterium]|nr:hypothetical protein [Cytophagaceae bacterium]
MRYLLSLLLCLSLPATAGENKYLGAIVVSGSSLTNLTTAAPFAIPAGSKLTINCTAAMNVLMDSTSTATTGATKGLPVPASTNFPTSAGKALASVSGSPSAVMAVIGTGTCDVWQRDGNE